jgi:hypothetical protein
MSGSILSNGTLGLSFGGLFLAAPPSGLPGGGSSGLASASIIAGGQSNMGFASTDGAQNTIAAGLKFYLGAAAATGHAAWGNSGTACTAVSGIGIYEIDTPTNYGLAFLDNTSGGGSPTVADAQAAPLGICGTGYAAFVTNLGSATSSIMAAISYWGETDALEYSANNKAVYIAACVNWMAKVRAMLGKTVAELPFWWFGPPYATNDYVMWESWAQIAADPAQNAVFLVTQTSDSNTRGATWNPTTGYATVGTVPGHRDAPDNIAIFNRGCLAGARSILASNGLASDLIPTSLGSGLGPSVVGAVLSGDVVDITIQHDAGTDLIVPLLASQGVGWAVMDGGSNASPGSIIQAVSCVRTSSTTLAVTLAKTPTNAATACRLFYPWFNGNNPAQPYAYIGRGDAVTDNWSSVSAASGAFNIAGALGSTYGNNMPVQPPMTLSGTGAATVAEYGIALT